MTKKIAVEPNFKEIFEANSISFNLVQRIKNIKDLTNGTIIYVMSYTDPNDIKTLSNFKISKWVFVSMILPKSKTKTSGKSTNKTKRAAILFYVRFPNAFVKRYKNGGIDSGIRKLSPINSFIFIEKNVIDVIAEYEKANKKLQTTNEKLLQQVTNLKLRLKSVMNKPAGLPKKKTP